MLFLPKYRLFQVMRPSTIFWRHTSSLQVGLEGVRVPGIPQRFSYPWLRDSCQCPQCVHPTTKQKLHESSFVDAHVRPRSGEDSVSLTPTGDLSIDWDANSDFTGSPHTSVYSRLWLERYASPTKLKAFHRDLDPTLWEVADIEDSKDLFVSYEGLKDRPTLLRAMRHFIHFGLIFIHGVPSEHTDGASCELQNFATIFGEIRETFYGRVWDVRNVKNSKNIAYTDLNLDLHMDLLYVLFLSLTTDSRVNPLLYKRYFQHPPRYQILHCLRNRVQGGESVFVDAFAAAEYLYRQSPDSFNLLATHPVGFQYLNDNHHLHRLHTTFVLTPPHLLPPSADHLVDGTPALDHINYSPPFQAPLPVDAPRGLFTALAQFSELLKRPEGRYVYRLQESDAVLFDNRRVLHARAAFKEWQDHERPNDVPQTREGESSRWLKGCYLEADALLDRMRVLEAQLEEV